MPPTTSATGGYLVPETVPSTAQDIPLENQVQEIVTGISGIPGALVRPRWQERPPKIPAPETNWAAIGITTIDPDDRPAIIHHSTGDGFDEMQRHETITLLCSFYGPNSAANAALFRDGLAIPQNREVMWAEGMGLLDVGSTRSLPELVNEFWYRRVDLEFRIRRQVDRVYPVRNLLSAQGIIHADEQDTAWDTTNAEPL